MRGAEDAVRESVGDKTFVVVERTSASRCLSAENSGAKVFLGSGEGARGARDRRELPAGGGR